MEGVIENPQELMVVYIQGAAGRSPDEGAVTVGKSSVEGAAGRSDAEGLSSEGIDGAPGRSAEEGAVGVEGIEGEEGAEGTEALPPDAGVLTFVVPSWSATGLVALTLTLAMATLVCKLRFPRIRRSDHALSRLSGEGSPRFLTFTKPVALPRVLVTLTWAKMRSTGDVTSKHPDRQAMPMRKPDRKSVV